MIRGYFEIGIYQGKTPANLGTLWRSAFQLGAAGIFLTGDHFKKQASDTVKAYRHIPLREYRDFDHFQSARPYDCMLVGVEMGGRSLSGYTHPERAIYLLGAEDSGLPIVTAAEVRAVAINYASVGGWRNKMTTTVLVYDFDLKRPACVLIQAAFGCATNTAAFRNFDPSYWLTSPTPGMCKVIGTDAQWRRAVEITEKHNAVLTKSAAQPLKPPRRKK